VEGCGEGDCVDLVGLDLDAALVLGFLLLLTDCSVCSVEGDFCVVAGWEGNVEGGWGCCVGDVDRVFGVTGEGVGGFLRVGVCG